MNYLKEIDNGLIIEEPRIILPWNLQKKELFNLSNNISVISENYYVLKIALFKIPFINSAGLHFVNEKLSKIELFNDQKKCSPFEINDIFNNNQIVLESLFGKPNKNRILWRMFTKVNKNDIEFTWKFRCITLTHKLWDRFGVEENIIISINSQIFNKKRK